MQTYITLVHMDAPATTIDSLTQPFTLPNGTVIPNRLAKAALSECLAGDDFSPGTEIRSLYRRWAGSGQGPENDLLLDPRTLQEELAGLEAPLRATGGPRGRQLVSEAGRTCDCEGSNTACSGREPAPTGRSGIPARPSAPTRTCATRWPWLSAGTWA